MAPRVKSNQCTFSAGQTNNLKTLRSESTSEGELGIHSRILIFIGVIEIQRKHEDSCQMQLLYCVVTLFARFRG
ncbi:hypothetical protein TorRG33x02_355720 [Trema orientale]|uniref:Uncharacterized protein n=1 Tax=Trema orientale TaxID=63057 RepID=A0A2P5A8R9_TREOI|nr:hypothetical protein TorRG33x02_355720 [Trema orientale]